VKEAIMRAIHRLHRWRLRAVAAALMLLTPAVAAADMLVLRSSGPTATQFRPGSRIADGRRIQLRQGDRLLVLDGRSTRSILGPTSFVAGSRRIASADLLRTWRQRGVRSRSGAVRGEPATRVDRYALLVERAVAAATAGDYAQSDALLAQVEAAGFTQRVQCRVVRNQRLYNLIAQGRTAEAAALPDTCLSYGVPRNLREQMDELDRDAQAMSEAISAMRENR
jgi:hypothetical protein